VRAADTQHGDPVIGSHDRQSMNSAKNGVWSKLKYLIPQD